MSSGRNNQAIAKRISEIFTSVQESRSCHAKYIKKLKQIYEKCEFEFFLTNFIKNLRVPLACMEKAPAIEFVLQFCAKFANGLQPPPEDEDLDEMCPFLAHIFEFLLTHHNAKDKAVRYRICYFLNMILDTMGDNASIEDDLCNKIMSCMMDRIQDKVPKVRAQAAIALHRLQEPTNPNCLVINVYLFHLSKDPSAEVRRVILAKMAKSKSTLHAAIKRTRDVEDSVRKMAYLFISKITAKSLTILQRQQLINNGLNDRSENIKKCVRDILIPSWLRYYDNSYINLMKAIDAEHAPEAVSLALNCLFKKTDYNVLIEQLTLDGNKFVPIDQLTCETALYWRCLAEFLKTENLDEFDLIMPELSPLCTYIRDYIKLLTNKQTAMQWEQKAREFILLQLFEMVKLYDLADELGRKNLKELTIDTLTLEDCPEKIDECLVKYFESVVPDVDERVSLLVEVINEKKMPMKNTAGPAPMTEDERHERKMKKAKLGVKMLELEDDEYNAIQHKDYTTAAEIRVKVDALRQEIDSLSIEPEPVEAERACDERNDPKTITQCLRVMYFMMQSKSVRILTPMLRTLMESLVLPCLNMQDNNDHVLSMALNCLGTCCHADRELAKKYFMIFFVYITESENEELWIIASKIIFDLLLKHGLECFNINQNDEDSGNSDPKKSRSVRLYNPTDEDESALEKQVENVDVNNSVVKVLMTLLESHVEKLQTVAVEGLCKLLLHSRICSSHLITQLLILWHNPTIRENAYLTQCLCQFFPHYVNRVRDSYSVLEEAYLPTLKIIANAPDTSPLQEIEILRVSQVIIGLTAANISNTFGIHNNLTFIIITEALSPDPEIPIDVLIKSLKHLDVQFESQDSKRNILEALDQLETAISSSNKKLLTILQNFRQKVITPRANDSEVNPNATENETNNPDNTQAEGPENNKGESEEMHIDDDSEDEPEH